MIFFNSEMGKHVLDKVSTVYLEHVRCLSPEISSDEWEIICLKVSKCKHVVFNIHENDRVFWTWWAKKPPKNAAISIS
jgi:hypothetical protein